MGRNKKDFGKASGQDCVHCGDKIPEGSAHSTMHDKQSNATHHFDKEGAHMFSERNKPTYAGTQEFSSAGKHCSNCSDLADSAEVGGHAYQEYVQKQYEANQPDSNNDR
jgi:ribosomal protein S26